jgi:cytochrome c peroxidase
MKSATILLLASLVVLASCGSQPEKPAQPAAPATPTVSSTPPPPPGPEALTQPMTIPPDNPITMEKIALGKQLFFDKRLSKTGQMSCESCHVPEKGWTDQLPLSPKFDGSLNTRNTPTLLNVGFQKEWYWDGRAKSLEGQVTAAWKGQMGGEPDQVAMTLAGIDGYKKAFEQAMGGPPTGDRIAKALATFVRTIKSENSPWDRYERGDKSAASEDAAQGFMIFSDTNKANCTLCHVPPLYTDLDYHNVGVGFDKPMPDLGRGKTLADAAKQSGGSEDAAKPFMGAFKTPTVRSITETFPYFHNGQTKTLEEAVDFMLGGGYKNPNLDAKLKPKKLTAKERTQLLAFLKSLTPEQKPFDRPQIP